MSRRHLRFIRRSNEVFVEDLGSSNGTLLNGHTVAAPLRIEDGDTVSVGTRQITVRIFDPDAVLEPSTLLLKGLAVGESEEVEPIPRGMTMPMAAVTVPPPFAHQRCPRCATPASNIEDECSKCGFKWGGFSAASPTHNAPSPLNRRRHDRQPVELHLVYTSSDLEVEAVSLDLSESGVFVCSHVLDPIGTHCYLSILVEGGPAVRVRGVVRRVVEHAEGDLPIGLGVEFVEPGETERAWIRAQVRRLALLQ